mgnify:CR=1 FL=1
MNDLAVIDRFTDVFSRYIDSGFGLLGGEVAFLTATLVVIDMTLAGLFWAMGGADDVLGRLLKKTLYVGAFAIALARFRQKDIARSAWAVIVSDGFTPRFAEIAEPSAMCIPG